MIFVKKSIDLNSNLNRPTMQHYATLYLEIPSTICCTICHIVRCAGTMKCKISHKITAHNHVTTYMHSRLLHP